MYEWREIKDRPIYILFGEITRKTILSVEECDCWLDWDLEIGAPISNIMKASNAGYEEVPPSDSHLPPITNYERIWYPHLKDMVFSTDMPYILRYVAIPGTIWFEEIMENNRAGKNGEWISWLEITRLYK